MRGRDARRRRRIGRQHARVRGVVGDHDIDGAIGAQPDARSQVCERERLALGGIQRVDSGLWGLPLTDENLKRISELKQLRSLNLTGATLNDRGIDRPGNPEAERKEMRDLSMLTALVNLEKLDLSRLPVTEETLRPLRAMPKLRDLRATVQTPR